MIRRQAVRRWRKPLIVMTPKSLLRLPAAVSELSEFTDGGFQNVIPDAVADPAAVKKIVLCSGKVYYDLLAAREERDDTQTWRCCGSNSFTLGPRRN